MRLGRSVATLVCVVALATACSEHTAHSSMTAPAAPSFIINGTPTGAGSFASVGALLFDFDRNGVINGDDIVSRTRTNQPEQRAKKRVNANGE